MFFSFAFSDCKLLSIKTILAQETEEFLSKDTANCKSEMFWSVTFLAVLEEVMVYFRKSKSTS